MLEKRSLDAGKKFLGKFPIKSSSGHSVHRILRLSNESGTAEQDLSLIHMEGQIDIHASWMYEKVDEILVPQLVLMRDLYNETMAALAQFKLDDLTKTRNVMLPKFHLSLEQQGNLITSSTTPEDLRENYFKLVSDICTRYGVQGVKCEEDYVHERRMIIPVMPGYSVQISVPDGLTQIFEVHADNHVDYTQLDAISKQLDPMLRRNLGKKIKIYDDRVTNCTFNIHLDTSVPQRLGGKNLEKVLRLEN